MMFEMRRPRNPIAVPPGELGGHRLADELRERVGRLGSRLDRLVDRREGRRDVERQTEDRLARRPHDAPDAVGDRRREDVVGGLGIDPEGLALGPEPRGRDGREMDDRVGAGERILRLAEVGQVRDEAPAGVLPSWRASTLRTSWPCSRRSRTTHDPPLPLPPVTTTRTCHLLAASMTMAGSTRGGVRVRRQPPGPGRDRRRSRPMTPRRAGRARWRAGRRPGHGRGGATTRGRRSGCWAGSRP